jgi:alpha-mannosidase
MPLEYALAGMLLYGMVWAQSPQQLAEIAKSLPASDRTVIDRLGELDRLPEGQWRFHTGDVAHGENTDLDDSS